MSCILYKSKECKMVKDGRVAETRLFGPYFHAQVVGFGVDPVTGH